MSRATLERSVYFQCSSSCWRHQSVMFHNQNVLQISIRSESYSMIFGSISPQFFRTSGCEFKKNLAAVNRHTAQSLRPGVVLATLLGVKYSSSSLEKSYGSKDDWQNPEAVAEGMRSLLGTLSCLFTGTRWCLAQYSLSVYFRKASGYCAV